jgi:nucleotide-binding universal stress UspA family protein
MTRVLVAVDNSLAAKTVVAGARTLAALLDADVDAVHVRVDGRRTAQDATRAAGVPLRVTSGAVVERLVGESEADDVLALVIGARGRPIAGHPLGGTATAVATAVHKPVLIVSPDEDPPEVFKRVLVPLEGTLATSLVPRAILELAPDADLDVVALHVLDEDSLPSFTDQPQHEEEAWATEFLHRYCPWTLSSVRLETRIGRSDELVPLAADECGCDLIALGWSQEISAGRAPVVRRTLEQSRRPILLFPVRFVEGANALTGAAASRGSAGQEPA